MKDRLRLIIPCLGIIYCLSAIALSLSEGAISHGELESDITPEIRNIEVNYCQNTPLTPYSHTVPSAQQQYNERYLEDLQVVLARNAGKHIYRP